MATRCGHGHLLQKIPNKMLQSPDHSPLLDLLSAREIALAQVTATETVRDLALSAAMGQVAARDVLALQGHRRALRRSDAER